MPRSLALTCAVVCLVIGAAGLLMPGGDWNLRSIGLLNALLGLTFVRDVRKS